MKTDDPILLIEDDLLDVKTLERALRDIHAKNPLYVRGDGEAALAFLSDPQTPTPALVLLDLNMPRMNGVEFLKIVKAHPIWRKIPIVVLTTSREIEDRLATFDLSAAGYIVKPLDYSAFVEKMRIICQYWDLNETLGTLDL